MTALPEERAKTLILAGTNAERLDITQAIRARLIAEGSLGQEATTGQLKALDLTAVQMKYTHHFDVGNVVVPMRSYKRRGLEKGELYSVVGKTQDRLTLQAANGTHLEVDTSFNKAVYQRQQIAIAVGDRLKWTKNDRKLGRRNGQEFTVTAISGDSAQIQYLDGSHTETINLAQAQHLDYALVSTTYSSQGKTSDRVLIAADSTIGKESFYVAVSRAKYSLHLYTEDKAELMELAHLSRAKENPLELLRYQVREQVAQEPVVRASQLKESSASATEQPRFQLELPFPKQRDKAQSTAIELKPVSAPGLSGFQENIHPFQGFALAEFSIKHSIQEAVTKSLPEQEAKPMEFTLVHANTYQNRKAIKALGGEWDADGKGWTLPSQSAYEQALALCEASLVDFRSERKHQETSILSPFPGRSPSGVELPGKANDNLNTNQPRKTDDTLDPPKPPTIDGTSTGRRAGERLATSDEQVESAGAEAIPGIEANSGRLRELGVKLRKATDGVIERSRQADIKAERIVQDHGAADSTTARNLERASEAKRFVRERRQSIKVLADQLRSVPLEDVAAQLGLEPDRHDKHKWRGAGQIISITEQKFYDHLALKGGYGAIDLVMHVQGRNFKDALNWLSDGASSMPLSRERSPQPEATLTERPPFQPPVPDESKWLAVQRYLVETRQLPQNLVDELHRQGMIYADGLQNAVFVRKNQDGEITGANLRGTYQDSQFKGMSSGSRRDVGWFSFSQGQGKLERIVLVESAIDAMSAAALARQKTGMTMFMSADGAGAVPNDLLRQYQAAGVQVIVGYDADPAGEEMARIVMKALPEAIKVRPSYGKDWNEQLLYELTKRLWQRYSEDADPNRPLKTAGIVAFRAMNDSHSRQTVRLILEHDPELTKIRQRGGEVLVQNYLLTVMRSAEARMSQQNQQPQLDKQNKQKHSPGLEL